MPDAVVADPRPASTVVVLRDGTAGPEVFMVRRHEGSVFMGGAYVFPGGRVDAADRDGDASWCDGIEHAAAQLVGVDRAEAIAYHVAAARELFEEAGVLVARAAGGAMVSLSGAAHERFKQYRGDVHSSASTFRAIMEREGLRLAFDALVVLAHWVTPPIDTRQFDTRFFVTRVPPNQWPAHDQTETTHGLWLTPARAIADATSGDIVLPPPTWTTLRELERFATVEAALGWARSRCVVRRQPKLVDEPGRRMLLLPGDPLYQEVEDPEQPAETRFVLVDKRWRAERSDH